MFPFIVIHRHVRVTTHSFEADMVGVGENSFTHNMMHCFPCTSNHPPRCLKTDHTASNRGVFVTIRGTKNKAQGKSKSKTRKRPLCGCVSPYGSTCRQETHGMDPLLFSGCKSRIPEDSGMPARTMISFAPI